MDALARNSDEGRGVAAIRFGEVPSNLLSGDFRMGKPLVLARDPDVSWEANPGK